MKESKPFRVEVIEYTEEGALGKKFTTMYFDNVEDAKNKCDEFDAIRFENGNKRYKVNLGLLTYKTCADKAAFFAQWNA